jgi:hypothetical protein
MRYLVSITRSFVVDRSCEEEAILRALWLDERGEFEEDQEEIEVELVSEAQRLPNTP